MTAKTGLLLCALLLLAGAARAGTSSVWVQTGDGRMRADLNRLADAGLINLPLTDWPIPIADIERVMAGIDPDTLKDPALKAAYDNIESTIAPPSEDYLHLSGYGLAVGRAGLMRNFDTPARDDGDVSAGIAAYGYRLAVEIQAEYAFKPADKQPARLDGSNIDLRLGNWLLSLNTLDKWWGPSEITSLILSNNARPMPSFVIERATSKPFDVPVLRWLGPWRFIIYFAQAEEHRPDVDNSLFFGNRLSFRPVRFLELALERTAQFCGTGRPCNLTTLRNVLLGNDTTQYASPENRPGHAQAGYEARINSPFQQLPLALYYQTIGNDEINRMPARLMRQFGAQSWYDLENGDRFEAYVDYSDSTCGAGRTPPQFGCAYRNNIFFAGYRYRNLNIADWADADSIVRAAGMKWIIADGEESQIKVLNGHLNRGNTYDPYNLVSGRAASTYRAVEALWRQALFEGKLQLQGGYEKQQYYSGISVKRGLYGYIAWYRNLR